MDNKPNQTRRTLGPRPPGPPASKPCPQTRVGVLMAALEQVMPDPAGRAKVIAWAKHSAQSNADAYGIDGSGVIELFTNALEIYLSDELGGTVTTTVRHGHIEQWHLLPCQRRTK